jgi:virginiamycin B lyase
MRDRHSPRTWQLIFCSAVIAVLCWPRLATAQTVTEFTIPTANSVPQGITAGPDGALWFTEQGLFSPPVPGKIGRITTAGVITEFTIPTANSLPTGITSGPDGALWFVEYGTNQIGRITTAGSITEFPIPTGSSQPYGITAGPDGALWFTESAFDANKIGRYGPPAGTNSLQVSPTTNIAAAGNQGGPFTPSSFNYMLSASSGIRRHP